MPSQPTARSPFRCEQLEARETPAGVADSFDVARFPFAPAGWRQWAANGQEYYGVTRSAAVSGSQSLAVYGTVGVESRLWNTTAVGGDVVVSAAVRSDAPAPVLIFGRGTNLDSAKESLVAVAVGRGGAVELREARDGTDRVLRAVRPAQPVAAAWLKVSLDLRGDQAAVRVQRADTNQYLNADGRWQADPATAVRKTVTVSADTGFAGVGRLSGPYGTAYVDDFAASPSDPGKPDVPRHYPHVRIAQLAYTGTPMGTTERNLLQDSVDLVIPNAQYLGTIDQTSPGTPQIIYSNVSNLYQNLLTDWLAFADRTGADREAAFYHVSQPTAWQGGSPSSQPVNWFWGVYRTAANGTPADLTANARAGRSTGVGFGGAGEAVAVGYADRFREMNVTLARPAKDGWSGVWEYATATDANGAPAGWKPLRLLADGMNGLRSSGQVTFDPPADWTAARVAGTPAPLFYVRFRTTAGTAALAPEARSIFGRDYVGANGGTRGTIPAFDSAADANRDGYLTDAEFAGRRAGFDARFAYESRLFYPYYGQMRFVTNPASDAVREWAADFHDRLLSANPLADGIFLDNSNGKLPFAGTPVVEPTANYTADSAGLVAEVNRAIAPRWVLANTSGAQAQADAVASAAGGVFEEFLLRPTEATWSQVGDVAATVARRLAANGPGEPRPYVVIDSHPGRTATTDPRTGLGVLAYYYLVGDPDDTFLMFYGGFAPAAAWSQKWLPAAGVNVGRPTAAMSVFAAGADPQNAALQYKVFGRQYEKALVLYKPRSYTLGKGTGTTDDATATAHQLGGNYRVLNADGTLGPVVSSVTLRNGEGAVLMRA